jgi:hypothetical protein
VAGIVATIAASHWTAQLLGRLDNRALSRRVAKALGCAPDDIAGLGPAAGHLLYDGFYEWDLGCVRLDRGCLEFRGEEVRFLLSASDVKAVRLVQGPPKWHADPVSSVEWSGGGFLLYWAGSAARARHAALEAALQQEGARDRLLPDFPAVSGISPCAAVQAGAILRSQAFVALYSTAVAALLDFPGGPYISLVTAAGLAWQYLPAHWRGRCC